MKVKCQCRFVHQLNVEYDILLGVATRKVIAAFTIDGSAFHLLPTGHQRPAVRKQRENLITFPVAMYFTFLTVRN